MSTLLAVSKATKSYNGAPALIDASLDLQSGEVHALMGENGAGKSTLIKLLAGVLAADHIEIALNDAPITIDSAQAAFHHGLRFIHQELNVVPQLSVAENIFLSHHYPRRAGLFVDWRRLESQARQALNDLGVTHINPRETIARLQPGDQMLVKIASAFVGSEQASIFVLDEPTAALTGEEAAMLFRVIERLKEQGCAALYVSHRMDEIFAIADRVTVMRDGRTIATKSIRDTSPADLIQLMTGRDLQHAYPARHSAIEDRILLDARNLRSAAIRDVSFSLRAGEIIGIAGLAGSGRGELIQAIMGADHGVDGEVVLAGSRLNGPVAAWRRGLGFVPAERRSQGLILSRSVEDNVVLPHLAAVSWGGIILSSSKKRSLAESLSESTRVRARSVQQITRELSGGNQQKTVFARAIARNPQALLLDEPTRGVDVGAKYDIYTLIRQLSAQGVGLLIASSDMPELIGLCDRILVMRHGHSATVVGAAGLTEAALLALCYGEM